MDKLAFGPGPWLDEPDDHVWNDAATGLACQIKRTFPLGHLCGYVAVAPEHPWHGLDYRARVLVPDRSQVEIARDGGPIALICEVLHEDDGRMGLDVLVRVHGGLTFADQFHDQSADDPRWWFGFDCAHAGDLTPASPASLRLGVYRDWEYVKAQCARLAAQLAAVA